MWSYPVPVKLERPLGKLIKVTHFDIVGSIYLTLSEQTLQATKAAPVAQALTKCRHHSWVHQRSEVTVGGFILTTFRTDSPRDWLPISRLNAWSGGSFCWGALRLQWRCESATARPIEPFWLASDGAATNWTEEELCL